MVGFIQGTGESLLFMKDVKGMAKLGANLIIDQQLTEQGVMIVNDRQLSVGRDSQGSRQSVESNHD